MKSLLSHLPIPSLFFLPSKEDTSDFLSRGFFPRLSNQVFPLPVSQVVLEHSTNSDRPRLPNFVTHREKPLVVFQHVRDFDGIFQDFRDSIPHLMLNHHFLPPPRLVLRINPANVNDRLVVDTETLPPQL